jgi:hypothetical protein
VIKQDIMQGMAHVNNNSYQPTAYDPLKHNPPRNEIELYKQHVTNDRIRDKQKMSHLLNAAAFGVDWFCQSWDITSVNTKHLPDIVRTSVKDGEFDESLEGVGDFLRGTIFQHPIFISLLHFASKVGEAHNEGTAECEEQPRTTNKPTHIAKNMGGVSHLQPFTNHVTEGVPHPTPPKLPNTILKKKQ